MMSVQPEEEVTDFTGVPNKDLNKKQRRARRAAKAGGYTDKDLNGVPDADEVDWSEVGAEWQWVRNLIAEIPDVEAEFMKHVDLGSFESQQGIQNFLNDVIDTPWWKSNGPAARDAFRIRTTDPAQYGDLLNSARVALQNRANELGAQVDTATIGRLAEQYVIEGWDERQYLMDKALADKIGMRTPEGGGQEFVAGDFAETLRQVAINNGLQYDNEYYLSAARSVASGLRSEDQWIRDIREEAASYWPVYGDQIRAGVDARSLLSGYINVMSRTLELDPMSIRLDDPYLRQATTMLDDSGKPRAQSLWEFQQALRDDPRWLNTDQGVKQQVDIGAGILRRFGIL